MVVGQIDSFVATVPPVQKLRVLLIVVAVVVVVVGQIDSFVAAVPPVQKLTVLLIVVVVVVVVWW